MREERSAIAKYRLSMSCRTSSERSLTAPRFSSCWSWIKSTFDLSSFISADTEDATIRYSLTCTKARIMAMFAAMATSLLSRPDSIATPCSVKAKGSADFGLFDVITICDELAANPQGTFQISFDRLVQCVGWALHHSGEGAGEVQEGFAVRAVAECCGLS